MSPSIRHDNIFEKNPNVYVEFTQEDARNPKEKVGLRNISLVQVPESYTFQEIESLNSTAKSKNSRSPKKHQKGKRSTRRR